MSRFDFLLYGANGYTVELIARFCSEYQLKPLMAGRNETALKQLEERFGYEYRVFPLESPDLLDQAVREVPLVLHAAGPFRHTAKPMMQSCLRNKVHYTDITGEIPVFELCHGMDQMAREAGIMMMSGVGFDVVPTDCLALFLKEQMPDAVSLQLAFTGTGGRPSRGTATTMAEGAGMPGAKREGGKIIPVPLGHKGMWVDFGEKKRFVMAIPWGDVSTAYYTTGIPEIETFTAVSPKTHQRVKYLKYLNWLLKTSFVRNRMIRKIRSGPAGPSDAERLNNRSLVWGEVRNQHGSQLQARLSGPEGYTLTAHASLIIARKIKEGKWKPGYQTPAGCFGSGLVLEIPGVSRELVKPGSR
jgi:short subunit dehydrogenase-like uncharacterized protein